MAIWKFAAEFKSGDIMANKSNKTLDKHNLRPLVLIHMSLYRDQRY